jgi:acyl carrier protein phosphodiesterase
MEGIQKAMNGMSKRTRFDSKMEQSVVELKADYQQILNEFRAFLPDLATHINSFKSKD